MDWTAVGAFAILLGGAIAVIVRGYGAPDSVFRAYQANIDRTKATIDGNEVIPRLVQLIEAVVSRATGGAIAIPSTEIEGSLRWAGYLETLGGLSSAYTDIGKLDELVSGVVRWARVRAGAAAIGLISLLPASVHFAVDQAPVPVWLWVGGFAVALAAFAVAGTAWLLDASARNELTSLFRRHWS